VASSCDSEGRPGSVRVERFSHRAPGGDAALVRDACLAIEPGECVLLTGPSGCGKSTLLRAIAGVLPGGGRSEGRIATGGRAALLLQNVETQLLFTRVEEEVASGLGRGTATGDRINGLLTRVGLAGYASRTVDALSAGEKQRVALAALLAREPALLLLDEPTSALDCSGRRQLANLLSALKARGHTLLVADHETAPFRALADRHYAMKEGGLTPAALPDAGADGIPLPTASPAPGADAGARVRCDALAVCDVEGRPLLEGLTLEARPRERVLVSGPNGSGKSTLLRAIAGLLPAASGSVRLDLGRDAAAPGAVGLLFQNPQRSLFEHCVADEVAFALRRRGLGRAAVERRVEETLAACGLAEVRDRSPLRLSFGEQHRVALAAVLAPEPALLLVDEPFSGLDREARGLVLALLAREQRRTGMTIVLASHDREPLARWAHRVVDLPRGGAHG